MVKVSYDTIEWPNKVNLDPEVLYEKVRQHLESKQEKDSDIVKKSRPCGRPLR